MVVVVVIAISAISTPLMPSSSSARPLPSTDPPINYNMNQQGDELHVEDYHQIWDPPPAHRGGKPAPVPHVEEKS